MINHGVNTNLHLIVLNINMRKFYTQFYKEKITIFEVEVRKVTGVEDPSVMWLKEGEYKAKVLSPSCLLEKDQQGKITNPVWFSHIFNDSLDEAKASAKKSVVDSFNRNLLKFGKEFSEQEVEDKVSAIEVIML